MIQTTNHKIIQLLLCEGANYFCNGGLTNLVELLEDKLNITKREAYEILLGCNLCERDKTNIQYQIKKCEGLSDEEIWGVPVVSAVTAKDNVL